MAREPGEGELGGAGLVWRVLGAWADLRGSLRTELARVPVEGRLLFYAMLSGAIWAAGEVMVLRYAVAGTTAAEEEFLGRAAGLVGAALFARTLALYGVSALAHAVARALGGQGGWYASRAAVFWAALVSAPAMMALSLLTLLVTGEAKAAGTISQALGSVILAWAMGACLAEAHGFASIWRGMVAVVAVAVLIFVPLALLLQLG